MKWLQKDRVAALVPAVYLLVVLSVQAWAWVMTSNEPESFAGLWVVYVTAPLSLVCLPIVSLLDLQGLATFLAFTLTGIVQAWFLRRIVRSLWVD